jgi:hypothetical protein
MGGQCSVGIGDLMFKRFSHRTQATYLYPRTLINQLFPKANISNSSAQGKGGLCVYSKNGYLDLQGHRTGLPAPRSHLGTRDDYCGKTRPKDGLNRSGLSLPACTEARAKANAPCPNLDGSTHCLVDY